MLLFIFLFIHFTVTIFITIPGTPERYDFNSSTGVADIRGCDLFLASLVYIVFSKLFKVLLFDHLKNINGKKVEKPTESFFPQNLLLLKHLFVPASTGRAVRVRMRGPLSVLRGLCRLYCF